MDREAIIDWTGCPLVVRREGYLGGGPALRNDPRVMPEAIVDNMDDGMSAEEVVGAFELSTSPVDAQEIYDFALRQHRRPEPSLPERSARQTNRGS